MAQQSFWALSYTLIPTYQFLKKKHPSGFGLPMTSAHPPAPLPPHTSCLMGANHVSFPCLPRV